MLATGKIRNYQVIVGSLQMMNLPISYILLRLGMIPETVFIVSICISQCCLVARLYMLRGMIGLSARKYVKNVYANVIVVAVLSFIIPSLLSYCLNETFLNFILTCLVSIICTGIAIYWTGCSKKERQLVMSKTLEFTSRFRK